MEPEARLSIAKLLVRVKPDVRVKHVTAYYIYIIYIYVSEQRLELGLEGYHVHYLRR